MNVLFIAGGILWFIGALAGVCTFLEEGSSDSKHYAIAVFWPLFLVIYLIKGLLKALWTING